MVPLFVFKNSCRLGACYTLCRNFITFSKNRFQLVSVLCWPRDDVLMVFNFGSPLKCIVEFYRYKTDVCYQHTPVRLPGLSLRPYTFKWTRKSYKHNSQSGAIESVELNSVNCFAARLSLRDVFEYLWIFGPVWIHTTLCQTRISQFTGFFPFQRLPYRTRVTNWFIKSLLTNILKSFLNSSYMGVCCLDDKVGEAVATTVPPPPPPTSKPSKPGQLGMN